MLIEPVTREHYASILKMNAEFVHWLAPLDEAGLVDLLALASYKKQIDNGAGVLIGYTHDVDYDHKNLKWLRARYQAFYYIDRVIINAGGQGKGYGRKLYEDLEAEARQKGLPRLVCEVNIKPNNAVSHAFHLRMGFHPIGDVDYPDYDAALRYYEKPLFDAN